MSRVVLSVWFCLNVVGVCVLIPSGHVVDPIIIRFLCAVMVVEIVTLSSLAAEAIRTWRVCRYLAYSTALMLYWTMSESTLLWEIAPAPLLLALGLTFWAWVKDYELRHHPLPEDRFDDQLV